MRRMLPFLAAAVLLSGGQARAQGADTVVAEITRNGGKALAVQGDVAKEADVKRLFESAIKTFGKLDILVNNAGIYQFAPLEQVTEEQFHRHFDTNVLDAILAAREAAKYFGPDGGSVINISSVASTLTPPQSVVYSATKSALDGVTRVLAKELGPKKIRVNCISAGPVQTLAARGISGFTSMLKHYQERAPLKRSCDPAELGATGVFLASDAAAAITGQVIYVDGGYQIMGM